MKIPSGQSNKPVIMPIPCGQDVSKPTKRTWHNGPPPFPGWWNASDCGSVDRWRWWDGHYWSWCAYDALPEQEAAFLASRRTTLPRASIQWTDYWPENARVPRIDPRSEK